MNVEDYPLPESIEDREALIERIWASIADERPVSDAVRAIVLERHERFQRERPAGVSLNELLSKLAGSGA